jgi:hypothetical protein
LFKNQFLEFHMTDDPTQAATATFVPPDPEPPTEAQLRIYGGFAFLYL